MKHHPGYITLRFLMAALLLCGSAAGMAAGLQVSPVMLEFASEDTARSLWLSNTGNTVLHAQVRVLSWAQEEGREQLEPTRALIPSPPVVEVAPGERQMVRIVRLEAETLAAEQSFRLLIDELPQAPDEQNSQGLNFLLQYSLPVFLAPPGADVKNPARPALSAELISAEDALRLAVSNRGERRARLSDVVWEAANGERVMLAQGLLGYVLAGEKMTLSLRVPPQTTLGAGVIKAMINENPQEHELLRLDEER